MARIHPEFISEIEKCGAADFTACYNCGNCTAVCPLAERGDNFPRRLLRYSVLGLEEKIRQSPEPWLCYYCGDCSKSCPRGADPSGLMAALRRFTIRRYSIGRVADAFYSAVASGVAFVVLTAIAIAAIAIFHNPAMDRTQTDFLSFISLENMHTAGIAIFAFIGAAFFANVWIMYRAMNGGAYAASLSASNLKASSMRTLRELALQERFGECEDMPFRRWAHLLVSWGFMGMFLATGIILAVDFKWIPLPRWVSLVVGSTSGAAALVGLAYYMYLRFTRRGEYAKRSHQSDWVFLALLVLSIVSGYVMVAFRFLHMPMAAYGTYTFHLVFVFNLLMSLPFTKFAHIVYRPVALWLAGVK
jgi:heterodisulfide reductase subunit C